MQRSLFPVVFLSVISILFYGCHEGHDHKESHSNTPSTPRAEVGHSHDIGIDGGALAILGSHQFHAEAFTDEATGDTEIRIYTGANKPTKLDAKEVTITRTIDGKPKTYTLPAVEGGKTATFKINDSDLTETINDRKWDGELKISIMQGGVPCSGNLSKKAPAHDDHDHDHIP